MNPRLQRRSVHRKRSSSFTESWGGMGIKLCPLFLLFISLSSEKLLAQRGWCGTDSYHKERIAKGLDKERWLARYQNGLEDARERGRSSHIDTIPVVIHVIHEGGDGNISYQQIEDGIRVLNEDFRRQNSDTDQTRPLFDSLSADSEIHFRLARFGPGGNCTNGVTRTYSKATNNADNAVKSLKRWPTDRYLNFWLANDLDNSGNNTLLGYAQFPWNGIDDTYGIVMRNDRFGTIGTSGSDGRTTTHEVGHCLGLLHTFHEHGCGDDCSKSGDNICDTPPSDENTFGCDMGQNSCSNDTVGPSPYNGDVPDQIENYMSYDACQNMFSKGQKAVMKSALSNISGLQKLTSSENLEFTGVREDPLCKVDFRVQERIVCEGDSVHFQDHSFHDIDERTWIFHGGEPFFTLDQVNPKIHYPDPGLYDVELTVSQGWDSLKLHEEDHIRVLDGEGIPSPFMENMEEDPIKNARILPRQSTDGTEWTRTERVGASGQASLLFENDLASSGRNYAFETTTIDASDDSSVAISFKVAYRQKEEQSDETLKVYASKGCGANWSLRGVFNSNQLRTGPVRNSYFTYPDESEWKTLSIVDPLDFDYNVEGLRFRFEFESGGGNNIYIDDINVADPEVLSTNEGVSEDVELELYPNPAKERVHVDLNGMGEGARYELKESSGRSVKEGRFTGQNRTIDIGSLSSGLYFLEVKGKRDRPMVKKLLIR